MRAKKDILDLLDKETKSMAKKSDLMKCENQAMGERRHKNLGGFMSSVAQSFNPLSAFPMSAPNFNMKRRFKEGGRTEKAMGGVGKERKGQLY